MPAASACYRPKATFTLPPTASAWRRPRPARSHPRTHAAPPSSSNVSTGRRLCADGGDGAGGAPPIPAGPYVKKIRKRDDTEGQQLSALASLPGIGEKLAVRLLGRFGTPLAALNAPLADLAKVDGLGAARARRIRHVLESTSRHHGASAGQKTLHDG